MVSNFKVSIVALLVSVAAAAVSAVESGDEHGINVEYHQIPVMHDGGTTMHQSDGEFDFHHGSSNVQYEATSRSEFPQSHQHLQMLFYPHQYPTATQKQPQHVQIQHAPQKIQHTQQQIQYLPQQTQHAPQQFQHSPQQFQHFPQQIQHAQQQIQHAPQVVQYHARKPSMREQGWIPIVGTPQGWVPIKKPIPPPHMWKHQSPPKKFVYVSKPKYSGPKHAPMKQVIHHVPVGHGSQKMVALPVAEHTLRLDIPHPFKIPDNKHEVVHIPEEQLSKYLAQMGVQYKTDDGMLTARA